MRSGKYFSGSTIWLQPQVFSSITLEVTKKKQKKPHLLFYHDREILTKLACILYQSAPGKSIFKKYLWPGKPFLSSTI